MGDKNIFKGLNLDRDKLHQWVQEFAQENFQESSVEPIRQVNEYLHRCIIIGDGKEVTVDFYYNADGKTTIQPKVGQHQDISFKLATSILARLDYKETDVINRSYSVQSLDAKTVEFINEYLQELDGVSLVSNERNSTNRYSLYQYKSKIGDKITLKYYDNRTFQIQGKPLYLYQEVACLLSNYFPFDEVIKTQSEYFSVDISPADVRTEMQHLLPNAYNALDEQYRKILSSALALRKIDIPLEDYSGFVFPALRTLEGYLKFLFLKHHIVITQSGFGEWFDSVGKGNWVLTQECQEIITCNVTREAIEKCYKYWNTRRHGLFHTEAVAVATRIIQKKQNADGIINEVLDLIESTYSEMITVVTS